MPFSLKHKMIIGGAAVFLITAGLVVFNKPKIEPLSLPVTYSENFENFETGTKIEIIYADSLNNKIENKNLEITENKTILNHDNNFSNIIYKIGNNDAFIDINLSQNNNIVSAEISGLPIGAKVRIGQEDNHSAIPVDWAGNITLSSDVKNSFCLSLINNRTFKICHQQTQQVAS